MPKVVERMQAVKAFRAKSKRKSTLAIADYPTQYNVNVIPTAPFLVVPEVSSERRDYIPIAWLEPPVIPSNKVRILPNASLWQFGLLTSTMHMAWVRNIGGRLKSDFSYGIGIIYNTFPLPSVPTDRLQRLAPHADAVLARPAPTIPTQRWPTSTTPTSCPPTSAKPTKPSTAPSIDSTAAAPSPPTASASNISLDYTKKCWCR